MEPYDIEKLKEELVALKKDLNEERETNKIMKASQEQYRKRALFAKSKYNDIKKTVTTTGGAISNQEGKYRLMCTELKN